MKKVICTILLACFVCATPGLSQAITANMTIDWFCNGINEGSDGSVTLILNKNGTFTSSGGGSGTWGTRLVNGKGVAFISYNMGCFPLYTVDLTTGQIIYDCRDGGTLGPNSWPNAKPYSCAQTKALNKLTTGEAAAEGSADPAGLFLQ